MLPELISFQSPKSLMLSHFTRTILWKGAQQLIMVLLFPIFCNSAQPHLHPFRKALICTVRCEDPAMQKEHVCALRLLHFCSMLSCFQLKCICNCNIWSTRGKEARDCCSPDGALSRKCASATVLGMHGLCSTHM